jgi:hypothetical protein
MIKLRKRYYSNNLEKYQDSENVIWMNNISENSSFTIFTYFFSFLLERARFLLATFVVKLSQYFLFLKEKNEKKKKNSHGVLFNLVSSE